jgi:hypothetical protein
MTPLIPAGKVHRLDAGTGSACDAFSQLSQKLMLVIQFRKNPFLRTTVPEAVVTFVARQIAVAPGELATSTSTRTASTASRSRRV